MLLKNKIAIVTGAGRGIGRAIALDFAKEGANVVVVSRSMDELIELSEEIKRFKVEALPIKSDISLEEDVKHIFSETISVFKRLDILINNAGIHLLKPILDTTVEEWDRVMEINLRGTFLCCREALKIMIPQNYGKIINISSASGVKGSSNLGAYCASKFGQIALTQVIADEVKDLNININAVLPSAADTKIIRDSYPGIDYSIFIKPEDIARVVAFMVSESASVIKGASIEVYNAQNYKNYREMLEKNSESSK